MSKKLEFTDGMIERIDEIDNAVFDCIKILAENPDMDWDMEIIGEITDEIKYSLFKRGIKVRHPAIVTELNGEQSFSEYDEYADEKDARNITLVWSIEDVQELSPNLTDDQAMDVLDMVKRKHDASLGVTWDTLQYWADTLYPGVRVE